VTRLRSLPRHPIVLAVAAAAIFTGTALAVTGSNPAAITINDCCTNPSGVSPASLYPSTITFTGETGIVSVVTTTITAFSHGTSDDVDILLVAPNGATVVLMGDAGGFTTSSNLNITFSDSAGSDIPDSTALSSASYRPKNYGPTAGCSEPNPEVFPSPGPAGPYGSTMANLNGQSPNGDWKLFVVDDCALDSGVIQGGWSITLMTVPTAVTLRDFRAIPLQHSVLLRWRTSSEAEILGFNVFRGNTRLSRTLIPAKGVGSVAHAVYRFIDRRVRRGSQYTYRLQAVKLNGTRSWVATAGVRIAG
jgi:hypothetical protein